MVRVQLALLLLVSRRDPNLITSCAKAIETASSMAEAFVTGRLELYARIESDFKLHLKKIN